MKLKLKMHPLTIALALAVLSHSAAQAAVPSIKVNQVGFETGAVKVAVVPAAPGDVFEVVRADTGASVLRGKLSEPSTWKPSEEKVRLADFSSLTTPGDYRIKVAGNSDSAPFSIGLMPYRALNAAALRAYYLARASVEIPARHGGVYARPLAHLDDKVLVHQSAASKARPAGTVISSPKGWYDAGDYNKYIINSGITTYTLLAAYEHFPAYFARQNLNIPESVDAVPDILNEALWNLEWMLTMQDPNDGGVYNKLTNKRFDGMEMPHQVNSGPRYVVAKSTASALDFAAVMATASRVFKQYEAQYPGLSAKMLLAAENAWKWAEANPAVLYKNPDDIKTGEYGDKKVDDERAWAAAELYVTTARDSYYKAMKAASAPVGVPSWSDVGGLPWISLAHHLPHLTPAADRKLIEARVEGVAAKLLKEYQSSAYRLPMTSSDFVWGSSAVALNQSMMLVQAFRLTGKRAYLDAAQAGMDYVVGRNPLGTSLVTGFGAKQVMKVHHRPSVADGIDAPWPGMLSGGPQPQQQDAGDCPVKYPTKVPALSFIDHECSYASNEIAINWNAPLVYVSAALDALGAAKLAEPNKAAGASAAGATQAGGGKMEKQAGEKQAVTLETIGRQEKLLQFPAFNNDTALEIGNKIIDFAKADKVAVSVDITMNGTQLFYHGMVGTTRNNQDWIRRKNNLVNRTGHASFYVHTEVKNKGGDFDNLPTFDRNEYAAHGGAFPLVVKGVGQVGTITVSGLPGEDDHAMVIRALKWYLKVDEV